MQNLSFIYARFSEMGLSLGRIWKWPFVVEVVVAVVVGVTAIVVLVESTDSEVKDIAWPLMAWPFFWPWFLEKSELENKEMQLYKRC